VVDQSDLVRWATGHGMTRDYVTDGLRQYSCLPSQATERLTETPIRRST